MNLQRDGIILTYQVQTEYQTFHQLCLALFSLVPLITSGKCRIAELQIRRVLRIEHNSNIFFLFLNENICCGLTLEPSRRDGLIAGSKYVFMKKYGQLSLNCPCYPFSHVSGVLADGKTPPSIFLVFFFNL